MEQTIYTIRKDEQYGDVLEINGKDSICPFQTAIPLPMQTAMGGMQINLMRMPCSTQCPFALVIRNDSGEVVTYQASCKTKEKFFITTKEQKKSPIFSIK